MAIDPMSSTARLHSDCFSSSSEAQGISQSLQSEHIAVQTSLKRDSEQLSTPLELRFNRESARETCLLARI
jgi:hypothetical protein